MCWRQRHGVVQSTVDLYHVLKSHVWSPRQAAGRGTKLRQRRVAGPPPKGSSETDAVQESSAVFAILARLCEGGGYDPA